MSLKFVLIYKSIQCNQLPEIAKQRVLSGDTKAL